jgi:hypothetical protein
MLPSSCVSLRSTVGEPPILLSCPCSAWARMILNLAAQKRFPRWSIGTREGPERGNQGLLVPMPLRVAQPWVGACYPSPFLVPMLCVGTAISIPDHADRFPRWSIGTREGPEHGNQRRVVAQESGGAGAKEWRESEGRNQGEITSPLPGFVMTLKNRTHSRSRCHCEHSEAIPADAS